MKNKNLILGIILFIIILSIMLYYGYFYSALGKRGAKCKVKRPQVGGVDGNYRDGKCTAPYTY